MKFLLIGLHVFSAAAWAQNAIPAGTVLPAKLSASLDSGKARPGQGVTPGSCRMFPYLPEKFLPAPRLSVALSA